MQRSVMGLIQGPFSYRKLLPKHVSHLDLRWSPISAIILENI